MTQAYNLSQLANNLNTAGQLDATDGLVNAVPAANGGTGQSVYAVGDVLYASTTTALAKLPDVATGNVLISGGIGAAPSYGKVGLTTHISGTLPVANGGTGATTLTANNVLIGAGTSAVTSVAPGASGNVLTSNGTTWASAAPVGLGLGYGQTWQDVTGSRTSGVSYTNATGKPIMVTVTLTASGGGVSVTFIVGGVTIPFFGFAAAGGSGYAGGTVIIPVGATYSCSGTINSWLELR